jgi:hypothetical protein
MVRARKAKADRKQGAKGMATAPISASRRSGFSSPTKLRGNLKPSQYMFVQAKRFVEAHGGQISDIPIYGQDSSYRGAFARTN